MKVAVTGSSGYLGQLVLRRLQEDPEVETIVALDVVPSPFNAPKLTQRYADVRTADFTRDLRGCDAVYHLAFIVEPPRGMTMATIDAINVEGSRRVFQGAAAAGVPKIVYASSIAAYGVHADNPDVLTEASPLRPNPSWYYSRTKGEVEQVLDRIQGDHDMVIIRLRPCIFLGPTTNNTLARAFSSSLCLVVRPDHRIDLCWDEDVAEAFHLALRYPRSDVFNLAGANPRTLVEYASLLGNRSLVIPAPLFLAIARGARRAGVITHGHVEWAWAMTEGVIRVSAERARERLGWSPRYDASQALVAFARRRHASGGARGS